MFQEEKNKPKLLNSLQWDLEGKKKAPSHAKYILLSEQSNVLRLPLKMYQGDGPG